MANASLPNDETLTPETIGVESHVFPPATDIMKERLSRYGLDDLPGILEKTRSVIAGSFPLQCIVNEIWPDSDIDIFCKHLIAYEFIEEYLLSIGSEKIETDKQYSGYGQVTNYEINHNDNKIIIELIVINNYLVICHLEQEIDIVRR